MLSGEKALRLIDETLKISDPISFYKRVDELCDDFIEVGLDIGDLNSFLGGVQKDKFLHAVKVLGIYEKSKNMNYSIIFNARKNTAFNIRKINFEEGNEEEDALKLIGRSNRKYKLFRLSADRNVEQENLGSHISLEKSKKMCYTVLKTCS